MSKIKTMKSQHDIVGAKVADWPKDGLVKMFYPLNEIAVGTVFPATLTEGISEEGNTDQCVLTDCDGIFCANAQMLSRHTISDVGDISANSFAFFMSADTSTDAGLIKFGFVNSNLQASTSAASGMVVQIDNRTYIGSNPEYSTGEQYPDGAVDQLILIVVDRENELVTWYAGTDGTTQYMQIDLTKLAPTPITKEAAFNWDGTFELSPCPNNYGLGCLEFPKGIPNNLHEVMQYINAELRAGRKFNWLNHWADMLEY